MCVESVCRVIELPQGDGEVALVDVDGVTRRISLALLMLEGVRVRSGDWLLTHTGLALRVLAAEDAERIIGERRAWATGAVGSTE